MIKDNAFTMFDVNTLLVMGFFFLALRLIRYDTIWWLKENAMQEYGRHTSGSECTIGWLAWGVAMAWLYYRSK
jgi:hypothetical protein